MRLRFLYTMLAAIWIVPVTSPAMALYQDDSYSGGSRLKPRAAQIVQSGPAAARVVLQKFAECLNARRTGTVARFFSLPVDTEEYKKMESGLFVNVGDTCLSGSGEFQFSDGLLRGALFEAAYRKRFRAKVPAIAPPRSLNSAAAIYDQPLSSAASRQLNLQSFSECVVAADARSARELILSSPETGREAGAIANLSTKMGPCLAAGQKGGFSKTSLRGLIAEALFQMSANGTPAPVGDD